MSYQQQSAAPTKFEFTFEEKVTIIKDSSARILEEFPNIIDIIKTLNSFLKTAIDLSPTTLFILSVGLWKLAIPPFEDAGPQIVGIPLIDTNLDGIRLRIGLEFLFATIGPIDDILHFPNIWGRREYRNELKEIYYWLRWALEAYSITDDDTEEKQNLAKNLGIEENNILFQRYSSEYTKPAYFKAINHQQKCLVISIRGSSNPVDWATDLTSYSVQFKDRYFHEGMLEAAKWLFGEEFQNLQDFFNEHEDYGLVLTGHSLGAGVASILTFILHNSEELLTSRDRIKCWAHACPACFDVVRVEEYAPFISTLVVQDDVVPRVSGAALEELAVRLDGINGFQRLSSFLLDKVKEVFGPKDTSERLALKVILTAPGTLHHIMRGNSGEDSPDISVEESLMLESDIVFRGSIISEEYKESLKELISSTEIKKGNYQLIKADTSQPRFDKIIVSGTMITDHLPDTYKLQMLKILKKYYL